MQGPINRILSQSRHGHPQSKLTPNTATTDTRSRWLPVGWPRNVVGAVLLNATSSIAFPMVDSVYSSSPRTRRGTYFTLVQHGW